MMARPGACPYTGRTVVVLASHEQQSMCAFLRLAAMCIHFTVSVTMLKTRFQADNSVSRKLEYGTRAYLREHSTCVLSWRRRSLGTDQNLTITCQAPPPPAAHGTFLPPHPHLFAIMSATTSAQKPETQSTQPTEDAKSALPSLGALDEDDEFEEFDEQGRHASTYTTAQASFTKPLPACLRCLCLRC